MQISDDLLKDALFEDDVLVTLLLDFNIQQVYDALCVFRSDLTFQLKNIEGTDQWRRQVTALIIRSKARIRQLEGAVSVKENRNR